MPLTIRQRSQQVADYIQTHAASTIATIAEATGLHPSSVHRHRQGLSRRQQYPNRAGGKRRWAMAGWCAW
jgi:DNA-binding IclR family transcriptional regulator